MQQAGAGLVSDPRQSHTVCLSGQAPGRTSTLAHTVRKPLGLLGNVGFDPVYGARPLKRAIQQQLENPLAKEILAGGFQPGDTIAVDAANGRLAFRKAA